MSHHVGLFQVFLVDVRLRWLDDNLIWLLLQRLVLVVVNDWLPLVGRNLILNIASSVDRLRLMNGLHILNWRLRSGVNLLSWRICLLLRHVRWSSMDWLSVRLTGLSNVLRRLLLINWLWRRLSKRRSWLVLHWCLLLQSRLIDWSWLSVYYWSVVVRRNRFRVLRCKLVSWWLLRSCLIRLGLVLLHWLVELILAWMSRELSSLHDLIG